MSRAAFTLALGIAVAAPVASQAQSMAGSMQGSMAGMDMNGMTMPHPAKKPTARRPVARKPVPHSAPKRRVVRSGPTSVGRAGPATAKGMDDMNDMPGMAMAPASVVPPSPAPAGPEPMPGMDMGAPGAAATPAMPGMDMSGHAKPMATMPGMAMTGTALAAGDAPAPPPPTDHYADRQFPASEMDRARHAMMHEQGGRSFAQVMFNLAEAQIRNGENGYRWDGEGWFGGDIDRLTIKSEGEGVFREGVEAAEVQALYSHAIGPYFNLQAGVRHDFRPSPTRTYATVGFEGLAPYWFEVAGALFLSDTGDVLGRLEGYYDQRITQRLILQPRIELNLSAQDVPAVRLGAGLTDAELGLRLRYEISRQFAPYLGMSYEAKTGRTADFARADGRKPSSTSLVAGVRFWF
ncbi:copper resistance protein B [Novosphingobium lentum]|uniref:copper resistance protein B n=1 Tax=Novosphingobium lentum TaxID=145287 RepID=UPI0008343359|nr:copper resistance protein B [Novosphingobium lentum]